MALWFSATAAVPGLIASGRLVAADAGWLSSAVQLGFVIGTAVSAILMLADRFDPRRIFCVCALIGAAVNLTILLSGPESDWALLARLITGICMAGVYPTGMKLAASWSRGDMGLMIGLLVGALSIGSATPHLFSSFSDLDWRSVFVAASASAALAGLLILTFEVGPNVRASPPLKPSRLFEAFSRPELRLTNVGYLGHMWELYAVWSWIGLFFSASFVQWSGGSVQNWIAPLATFAVIAIGGVGAMAAGLIADRIGRTTVTIIALVTSGLCCLTAGLVYGMHPAIVLTLGLIWGVSVIADSGQFSASIAELADPDIVGTMLTLQTCAGFLLTLVTIELIGSLSGVMGWERVFWLLAPGPFLGAVAMWRLRQRPEALKMANGKR